MELNKIEKKITFNLIDGAFLPNETTEIINHIVEKKIHFHELKNFSESIRLGKVNKNSVQRIEALVSFQNELSDFIFKSVGPHQLLKVNAVITIEINQ